MSAEELKLRQIAFEQSAGRKKISGRLIGFLFVTIVLMFCFGSSFYKLLQLACVDELYSEIPLIPLVSLYLIWLRRENLPLLLLPSFRTAILFFGAGLAAVTTYWYVSKTGRDFLPLNICAFLLFFTGICFLFFGSAFMRAIAFPMTLLVFIIPFPEFLRQGIETFLQHGSAVCAGIFFQLSGQPVFHDGLNFQFPNCVLQVAPECSGIHSTLVLIITGLVGGWLFLRSPWKRTIVALVVIPLALIRNGFRIFVIGRLCTAYGPQMLDSAIHRHGGPLFFALSLIPLFLLLLFLRKTERTHGGPPTRKTL
jgi:exosortase C (VPDSG-CTERM-specific)